MSRLSTLLFFFFLIITGSRPLYAQISPGKLATLHADLEGIRNCTKCHELGKEVSDAKCLDCHKLIQAAINAGTGFHSSDTTRAKRCAECHSDHHGRDFELIHWENGREQFNHDFTGYKLEGKHQRSECRLCHKEQYISKPDVSARNADLKKRTLLGLNGGNCVSCHDDEHENQLSDECLKCHNYDGWQPAKGFNHDETRYKLDGKHADTACEKCHKVLTRNREPFQGAVLKPERKGLFAEYSNLDFATCKSCHEDVHKGKLGKDCSRCHQTSGFLNLITDKQNFDHSLTDYPLEGRHSKVECKECHSSGNLTASLKYAACTDCHEDGHFNQFRNRPDQGRCESCHSVNGFLPADYSIDQHQQSHYPLTGSHLAIPCFLCHLSKTNEAGTSYNQYDFADQTCTGCHEDIHQGQADKWMEPKGCEYCHTTDSWHVISTFDHDSSRFKLTGKHRPLECRECHYVEDDSSAKERVLLKPIETYCAACHEDEHRGQFTGTASGEGYAHCEKCHTESGWKDLKFDHNRDSRYKLDGAHLNIKCDKCHFQTGLSSDLMYIIYKPLGVECADCHGTEDSGNSTSKKE